MFTSCLKNVMASAIMTLRREKLESVKGLLLSRREALARDLRQATQDFIDDEPAFADAVDQAAADVDRTLSMNLKNRERGVLRQIDEALRRIESGAFGKCEQCEEDISEARIKAFPFTTLCIDCKAELESEQRRVSILREYD
jgi:DnaK suppressor protein